MLFVWYVIISYLWTLCNLKKLYLGFQQYHEDFDFTEIDHMAGIEICLSNNSKKCCALLTTKGSIVHFQQQNEALFIWYVVVSYSQTFHKLEKLFLGF